jgi:peptidoglycan/xylan/chitin deacetylase (PgdA/CDA1 family)
VDCIRDRAPFPQRCLAITFDDGFQNFFKVAYPVLRDKKLPVTVFLSTGLIGTRNLFWFDLLEQLILSSKTDRICLQMGGEKQSLDIANKEEAIWIAAERLKAFSKQDKEVALKTLERDLAQGGIGPAGDDYLPMNWEDVCKLAKNRLVTFGSHTSSHSIVRGLNDEELHREIVDSKRILEQKIGRLVEHFSYPNGRPCDFDYRAKEVLAKAGYSSASTTIEELNHQNTDCFELRRIGASLGLAELVPKISGFDGFLLRTFGTLPGVKERSVAHTKDERLG